MKLSETVSISPKSRNELNFITWVSMGKRALLNDEIVGTDYVAKLVSIALTFSN